MDNFIDLVAKLGFPMAAAIGSGMFVFLILKFILAGVTSSITSMSVLIGTLHDRVTSMTNELQKVDIKVNTALGLEPDYTRVARATQSDHRKD